MVAQIQALARIRDIKPPLVSMLLIAPDRPSEVAICAFDSSAIGEGCARCEREEGAWAADGLDGLVLRAIDVADPPLFGVKEES